MKTWKYLVLLTALVACQETGDTSRISSSLPDSSFVITSDKKDTSDPSDTLGQFAYHEFLQFVQSLPCDRPEQIRIVAQEYKTVLPQASVKLRDAAFVEVWHFYFSLLEQLNLMLAQQESTTTQEALPSRMHRQMTNDTRLADSLYENGFQIRSTEGVWYIGEQPDFLALHFYVYLSDPMQAFLDQYQRQVREGFTEDATLLVSPKQLGERLVFWENFLAQNPRFPLRAEIQRWQRMYRLALLEGTDNSPAFDYESGQLTVEFERAFQYLTQKYPDSRIGKLLYDYQQVLQEHDWRKTPEIEEFLQNPYASDALPEV